MSTTTSVLSASTLIFVIVAYFGRKYLPDPPPHILAIDLGTTYSSIAFYQSGSGKVVILNDRDFGDEKYLIPSIVLFNKDGKILTGYHALNSSRGDFRNSGTLFYDSKRMIGKKFIGSNHLSNIHTSYPFELSIQNNSAFFVVSDQLKDIHKLNSSFLSPVYISSLVLKNLLSIAQKHLSRVPKDVVMAVPVEFTRSQRKATIDAAKMAGLNVLQILNEPTAAAMACGLHIKEDVEYILVFDLGGGTLDISILNLVQRMFVAISVSGNDLLGGQNFTEALFKHVDRIVENSLPNHCEHRKVEDIRHFLRSVSDEAKIQLSSKESASFSVPLNSVCKNFYKELNVTITRSEFEEVAHELFLKSLEPITVALRYANLDRNEIDEIVLVGGSTRMPKLRNLLREFFEGKAPISDINPDLAVITGLAIQSGTIAQGWPIQVSAVDVVPEHLKKIEL